MVGLTEAAKTSGQLQFETVLELRHGEWPVSRHHVVVTLAGQEFLDAYRQDRLANARQQLPDATAQETADILVTLAESGEFVDLQPTEESQAIDAPTVDMKMDRLAKLAEALSVDTLGSQDGKLRLYAGIERIGENLQTIETQTSLAETADKQDAESVVDPQDSEIIFGQPATTRSAEKTEPILSPEKGQQLRKQLGKMAIVLAEDIRTDLESSDTVLATAARRLRDTLVANANFSDLLWKGYGVNSRILEIKDAGTNATRYSVIYESGQLDLTGQVTVDIGRPAVVEITETRLNRFSSQGAMLACLGVSAGTPSTVFAHADTYI